MNLSGISIRGASLTGASTGIVTSGLTLHIDAGNSSSYGGSGTTWTDIAGTADNITLVGSPAFTSGTPSYFSFNGSSQYGSGSATNILPSTSYTKIVWFYLNSFADNNLVSSATGGHFIFFNSSNKMYCGHANWSSYIDFPSITTFSLSTWYFAALTFTTADGMKLYINGSLDNTYTTNKTARGGNGSINIATFGGGNLLNGRISKVLCYDRAITAAEALQNFNADKSIFGL